MKRRKNFTSSWWFLLLEGSIAFLFGILMLFNTTATAMILIQLFGLYWLVSGAVAVIQSIRKESSSQWNWELIGGILGIGAGLIALLYPFNPGERISFLVLFLFAFLTCVIGIVFLILAIKQRSMMILALCLINLSIGLALILGLLTISYFLVLLIAVISIIGGVGMILYALYLRKRESQTSKGQHAT